MELSEQEAHCIARLLQGTLFGKSPEDGCQYCKFRCFENRWDTYYAIRKRLTEATGVDLGFMRYGQLPHSEFPYGLFLKNSSEQIKAYYRDKFNRLLGDI